MKRWLLSNLLIVCAFALKASAPDVYFVNIYPGPSIYELEGHSALIVDYGGGRTMAYNYGVFDFDSPNFVYRFVKGETDYVLAAYPSEYFFPGYMKQGRRIVAHRMTLDSLQTTELIQNLNTNALPQNRTYRYNYVKDNCATRPLQMVENVLADSIELAPAQFEAQSLLTPTFRNVMRRYHANYPWYQFGIDLALGSGIDYPISRREIAFAPAELDGMLANATSGGQRIVAETIVMNDVTEDAAIEGATPWYLTPMFVCWLVLAIAILISWRDVAKGKLCRSFDAIYFGISGLAGSIIAFLVFVSVHEATSPNLILIWLNPLLLLVPILAWIRRASKFLGWFMAIYGGILLLMMLIWPLQTQSTNAAFFPLMAAAVLRCAVNARFRLTRKSAIGK